MTEMMAVERIDKHVQLIEPDRVSIAPWGGFYYAALSGMSVEEYLQNLDSAERAYAYAYEKHGGLDMAEIGADLAAYFDPTPNTFSTFYYEWHLPGRERSSGAIPNLFEHARDDPLMTEDDYELILREGLHRFFSFKRAGVRDLIKMEVDGARTIELCNKWRKTYQVPTTPDCGIEDPFGLLSQLRGSTNFMLDLRRYPDKVLETLDVICDGLIAAGLNLAELLEAETIIVGGSRGSADFMSPAMCAKFFMPFLVRTAYAAVEAGYRMEYHMDLNWTPMLGLFRELPPKSGWLHFDERTDMIQAKKVVGDHLCLQGNLKPSLFVLGTCQEVEREVKQIIDGCASGGGLIISSELTVDSKFELVDTMVQVTKEYGKY